MSKKILMIVGDYGEDLEIYFPFQALTMVGYEVHAVCPQKKAGDKIKTAVHDFRDGDQTYVETRGHDFTINFDIDLVQVGDYAGIVLPGGRAPEYLRLHQNVVAIVQEFLKLNKPIVAVCHGIQLLTAAGQLEGRQLTCYPACQTEVIQAKAHYKNINADQAITDGNIVTSPAWPGHADAFRQFIKLLGGNLSI